MEQNKKPPQAAGTAGEDNNKYKRIKNLNWSIRNFINVLLLIALPLSIYAALDTLADNKEMDKLIEEREQLNIRYGILLDEQDELIDLLAEELERRKEINNRSSEINDRISEILNRLHLENDQ